MSSAYAPEEFEQKKMAAVLAHPSKVIRDKGCAALTKYIRRNRLKDLEVLRLWKALHQCLWLTDKQAVQLELASFLSGLLNQCIDDEAMLDFFTAFWRIILKEWGSLDQFRVNKFLSLMRLMVHEAFKLLSERSWPEDLSVQMVEIMETEVLRNRPNGPRFHLADIMLTELYNVTDGACSHEIVELVMAPFFHIVATDGDPVTRTRVSDAVFRRYLDTHAHELAGSGSGEEAVEKTFPQASTQLLQKTLFELASSTEHKFGKGNRETLYELHGAFQRVTGVQFVEGEGDIDELEQSSRTGKGDSKKNKKSKDKGGEKKKEKSGKVAKKNEKEAANTPLKENGRSKKRKNETAESEPVESSPSTEESSKKKKKKSASQEEQQSPPEKLNPTIMEKFIKSKKFKGFKPGYVFKNDGKGNIGYHLDPHQSPQAASPRSSSSSDSDRERDIRSRRVSFGKNRAKDYTASIMGLKESANSPAVTRNRAKGVLKRK